MVAVGLAAILAAWGFELIGRYVPCALCLQQRVPYYIGLPVALAALLAALAGAKPTVVRTLLIVAALIFAFNVYLGAYHAGVEWGLWAGPADCAGTGSTTTTTGSLLEQIEDIQIVSCTEASWRLFFLSFAGWNVVISVFLMAAALWGAFRPLAPEPVAHAAE